MLLRRDVDHLHRDPNAIRRLSDAPLDDRSDPEFFTDLGDVLLLFLVLDDGRPSDHLESLDEG